MKLDKIIANILVLSLVLVSTATIVGCKAHAIDSSLKDNADRGPASSDGGIHGGGGVGVLCNEGGKKTLTLLDIYEAKEVYNFGEPKNYGSVKSNLENWNRQYDEARNSEYDPRLYDIEKIITGIFNPVDELSLTNDFSRWKELSRSCEYVQIAKFIDPEDGVVIDDIWKKTRINIVMPLYNMLDDVNKAALLQHEFNYFSVRLLSGYQHLKWGSDESRVVVAAMSTGNSAKIVSAIPSRLICDFDYTKKLNYRYNSKGFIHHFNAKEESENNIKGVRFYFQWISGYVFPLKATYFVPGLTEKALMSGNLAKPLEIEVASDIKIPGVKLRSIRIRLEKSNDRDLPLRVSILEIGNRSAIGECR